jgi:KipI family sensor histidine kinase inhibitor
MALFRGAGRSAGKLRIVPLGDSALLAEFSTEVDIEVNAQIQRVAAALRPRCPSWVRDVVPAIGALAVHFDLAKVPDPPKARAELEALIRECAGSARGKDPSGGEVLEVPVLYGGEFGPDLEAVAAHARMPAEEVVRRHTATEQRVLMVGFAPGHPYIGGLDPKLAVPRRATPRVRVPEGSVAIANAQTAVYPYTISGGWNVLGRTPLRLFDPDRDPPALFSPGQRIRFVAVDRAGFDRARKG